MTDKNIRIEEDDHKWIKDNRGSGSMKALVSKVIAKYKEVEHASATK